MDFLVKDYAHTWYARVCVNPYWNLFPFVFLFFIFLDRPNGWLPALNFFTDWKSLALSLWLSYCIIDRCYVTAEAVSAVQKVSGQSEADVHCDGLQMRTIGLQHDTKDLLGWIPCLSHHLFCPTASSIQNTCYEVFTLKVAVLTFKCFK